MNDRTRGELNIDEQGKKPGSDNPDYSDFKPRSQSPKPPLEPSDRTAEESGFTTRHAPPAPAKIDGAVSDPATARRSLISPSAP